MYPWASNLDRYQAIIIVFWMDKDIWMDWKGVRLVIIGYIGISKFSLRLMSIDGFYYN